MSNKIYCPVYGGGIFSKVMLLFQIIERNVGDVQSIESIYALNLDDRIDKNINPFDYVFDQPIYQPGESTLLPYHTYPSFQGTIPDYNLNRLGIIVSKIKHNPEILLKFNTIAKKLNFQPNLLGVHLRLTDMNTLHGDDYGKKTFDDYVNAINWYLKTNEVNQIYVAADNNESLDKLIKIYGDKLLYYRDFLRPDSENATVNFQLDNFSDKKLWQDSFVDMFLLAQCETLIHRVSNFANAAKVYSYNIKRSILI